MSRTVVSQRLVAVVLFVGLMASPAAGTLIDRGDGLVYDTDLDITWQSDAGQMSGTWYEAMTWTEQLEYAGHTEWRLPTVAEMQHLFYDELGGSWHLPIELSGDPDLSLFQSIMPTPNREVIDVYWSNAENTADLNHAYGFKFNNNSGAGDVVPFEYKWNLYNHGWAVHNSDIAAVPEPSVTLLLGFAACAIACMAVRGVSPP